MKEIYIVRNPYMDTGGWTYGNYSSMEKAKEALALLESDEEIEYVFTRDERDNFEIDTEYLQ